MDLGVNEKHPVGRRRDDGQLPINGPGRFSSFEKQNINFFLTARFTNSNFSRGASQRVYKHQLVSHVKEDYNSKFGGARTEAFQDI